jgi:hypothetical protein
MTLRKSRLGAAIYEAPASQHGDIAMTQLQDDIRAVMALLDEPRKWTKGAFARDANCNQTPSKGIYAACWCLTGACIAVTSDSSRERNLLHAIGEYIEDVTIIVWNDAPERTFEDIHAILNKALTLAY